MPGLTTVCRWTAGETAELCHTSISCTRDDKMTSEATLTAQKSQSPWCRVLDISTKLRRKPQLPISCTALQSIHTEVRHQTEQEIMRHSGPYGARRSLHRMQVSERNCSGGLTSISLQIKFDGRNCIPHQGWQVGGKYGCTSAIFARMWQLLIVRL